MKSTVLHGMAAFALSAVSRKAAARGAGLLESVLSPRAPLPPRPAFRAGQRCSTSAVAKVVVARRAPKPPAMPRARDMTTQARDSRTTADGGDAAAASEAIRDGARLRAAAARKAEAEAAKAEAEAAAAVGKGEAEVAAAVGKGEAEVAAAKANAAAAEAEAGAAEAEAGAAKAKAAARRARATAAMALVRGSAVLVTALVVEHVYKTADPCIRWHVRRGIARQQQGAFDMPALFPTTVPTTVADAIRVLLAPTGAGKTTAMKRLANECRVAPTPTVAVYVGVRVSEAEDRPRDTSMTTARDMNIVALSILQQIGWPAESMLSRLWRSVMTLKLSQSVEATVDPRMLDAVMTLPQALRILFEELEALYMADPRRRDPKTRAAAQPVLLFDEVQDLIRSDRLKNAGGEAVFHELARLATVFNVDRQVVRVVLSGSTGFLLRELDKTVASKNRVTAVNIKDPTEDQIRARLATLGYTSVEADRILDSCGTRLRDLSEILHAHPPAHGAALTTLLQQPEQRAKAAVAGLKLLAQRSGKDTADALRVVLDDPATSVSACDWTTAPGVPLERLPPALQTDAISGVLFLQGDRHSLVFQSRAHEREWRQRQQH